MSFIATNFAAILRANTNASSENIPVLPHAKVSGLSCDLYPFRV
jgi:hypothetical protein